MTLDPIEITAVNTTQLDDRTSTVLCICPQEWACYVYQTYPEDEPDMDAYLLQVIDIPVAGHPDPAAMRATLDAAQPLLTRICAGHTLDADITDELVGHLDGDATAALGELTQMLSPA